MKEEYKDDSRCLSKGNGLEAIMPDTHLTAGPVSPQPGHPKMRPPHDHGVYYSSVHFVSRLFSPFSSSPSLCLPIPTLTLKYPDKTIIIVNNLS